MATTHPTTNRKAGPLTPELEAELAAIAAGAGCELLAAEWKGGTLRLVLDRPSPAGSAWPGAAAGTVDEAAGAEDEAGSAANENRGVANEDGVSLGDCEHVSKQVSALLDVADFGNGRYLLEVSSPGLDRPLYRPADYRRFAGRLARVTFDDPAAAGRKRTVVGRLAGLDEGAASVTLALAGSEGRSADTRKAAPASAGAAVAGIRKGAPLPAGAEAAGGRQAAPALAGGAAAFQLLAIPLDAIRQARLEIELERREKKKR